METECDAEEELVSKTKNNGSIVWRWFGFKVSDDQQQNVFCKECRKPVATKSSSTTNLFHHLQQRHKVQYEECVKLRAATQNTKPPQPPAPKQTMLQTSFAHAVPYERTSEKWRNITKAVSYYIAKDMVPIATVEQDGFIQLLKTVNRRYQLPSRSYFAREAQLSTSVEKSACYCLHCINCTVYFKLIAVCIFVMQERDICFILFKKHFYSIYAGSLFLFHLFYTF